MSDEQDLKQTEQQHVANAAPEPEAPETEPDLAAELEKARAEAAEYLDGWQRARAEFVNYRKRTEREKEEIYQESAQRVLAKFLPVIDDLERALDNYPDELESNTWAQGIKLIGGKFHTLLESNGLTEINPVGEQFDPTRHEAVGMDDSGDVDSGHITTVLQKGYAYGDKVLRPAVVRVAN